MKVTVVIPIFNEEALLPELRQRLVASLETIALDWTVLFVDDGSADGSLACLRAFHEEDPRLGYVRLSRNFGLSAAISAGLDLVDADVAVVMDGDLQDPPEVIPELIARWREGADVVVARRVDRCERGPRRWGIEAFHRLFGWLSDYEVPGNTGTFSLMNRRALAVFRQFRERHRFLPGLRAWVGFDQREVTYAREARHAGPPKQNLRRLVRYALDAIFSFSYRPLRAMTLVGLMISTVAFLLASLFVFKRLAGIETAQTGFTTLVTVLLGLGGVQLIGLGLLGEYLGRIYDEVKARPYYVVAETCAGQAVASES